MIEPYRVSQHVDGEFPIFSILDGVTVKVMYK